MALDVVWRLKLNVRRSLRLADLGYVESLIYIIVLDAYWVGRTKSLEEYQGCF